MPLDREQQRTLGIMAGTLAQFLRSNPEPQADENGEYDADALGMHQIATGFLRLYKELYDLGVIRPLPIQPSGDRDDH